MFFQRLKNPGLSVDQNEAEVARLISGCDLDIKTHARAKTLSGGQKRKLQLAMMLAGGSRVCCIDEASSGIDPLARRKVWDILLQERGQRTMLLTTHFLDESEVLSDHVAVLSKGTLRAEGSVASLKATYGGGYRVVLPKQENTLHANDIPASVTPREDYNDAVFEVADTRALADFTSLLDSKQIASYAVHGPTIEDVFIGLSDEMYSEITADNELTTFDHRPNSDGSHAHLKTQARGTAAIKLNSGQGCGPIRQTGVLFMKRLTVLKHNYMPYIAALFVSLTKNCFALMGPLISLPLCYLGSTHSCWHGNSIPALSGHSKRAPVYGPKSRGQLLSVLREPAAQPFHLRTPGQDVTKRSEVSGPRRELLQRLCGPDQLEQDQVCDDCRWPVLESRSTGGRPVSLVCRWNLSGRLGPNLWLLFR